MGEHRHDVDVLHVRCDSNLALVDWVEDYLAGFGIACHRDLDETGLAEDTALILFSDHGDYAGDYGLVEKWPSACEDVITRVPLIVRTPGGAAGHVVEEPVELFDVMATTLEQAGIEWANAPGCNADSAAQYTLAMIHLACQRLGRRLEDQRVGIIGRGNVGSRLQKLLEALGLQTVANDPPLADEGAKGLVSQA